MASVLLIESDPARLVALSLMLRCFGYTVLEAGSRGDAWRACNEHKEPIHLAILDNDTSSEFVGRLQLLWPQVRALFVSDASQANLAEMPCEYAFLQRPFRVDTLADIIEALLGHPRKSADPSL